MEKVALLQLYKHMSINNLLEIFPNTYKALHSSETALVRVHNDILRAIDRKEAVFLVLLNLSAAFDTLDHNLLLAILNHIGIDGHALKWFASYLTNRTQTVTMEGIKSAIHQLLYAVSQGSVLSHILFCIYILNIGSIVSKFGFELHIYVDDTQKVKRVEDMDRGGPPTDEEPRLPQRHRGSLVLKMAVA